MCTDKYIVWKYKCTVFCRCLCRNIIKVAKISYSYSMFCILISASAYPVNSGELRWSEEQPFQIGLRLPFLISYRLNFLVRSLFLCKICKGSFPLEASSLLMNSLVQLLRSLSFLNIVDNSSVLESTRKKTFVYGRFQFCLARSTTPMAIIQK
jgi:hypothetical protein